ncbi:response regulator, partial [Aeromonas caviae]
ITAMPAPQPHQAQPLPHRLHILVVDDNHANQILLRQQLKHLGHDVSVRSNGLEALRALGHDLPVWGFTAHAQPRERELCLAAGMNDCLFKPIGLARLRAALATLGPAP